MLFLVGACDSTDIDPFDNEDRYFTIYGFLDELQVNHSVRVIPVTRFPEKITTPYSDQAFIDAAVVSTDLQSGIRTQWYHSLEKLHDGTYGHIFRANFIVRPGRTYRLEVIRSDSIITSAETTIPKFVTPTAIPAEFIYPYQSVAEEGGPREVILPQIASPWDITVIYNLTRTEAPISYGRAGARQPDGSWKFTINMSEDVPRIKSYFGLSASDSLPPYFAATLRVKVLDANWDPPLGIFDPEVLAQPGALTNVENGYGFWGGVGLFYYVWPIPFPYR